MASVGIALCTFNGERYVAEQLQSLARQTLQPDLIVVVDDASTDNTLSIVRHFARSSGIASRIEINPVRLGATASFAKAVAFCDADIIFLCDQDDVWYDWKIERMASAVEQEPVLAFCDADLVFEDLRRRGETLWGSLGLTRRERQVLTLRADAFPLFMRRNLAWGATMAFPGSARQQFLPLPPDLGHDTWIFFVLSSVGRVHAIDEPLFMYRQHSRQMYGAAESGSLAQRVASAARRPRQYQQVLLDTWSRVLRAATEGPIIPRNRLATVEQRIQHLAARSGLRDRRLSRLAPVLTELVNGRYGRFSNGVRSALLDLVS